MSVEWRIFIAWIISASLFWVWCEWSTQREYKRLCRALRSARREEYRRRWEQ